MNDSIFVSMVPYVQITRAETSLHFYCDQLGFTKNWEHQFGPHFPLCISVSRGAVEFYLTEHPESAKGAKYYIVVDNLEALFDAYLAKQLVKQGELEEDELGRSFTLKDPDGNRLVFNAVNH